jgi:hypothetical protein
MAKPQLWAMSPVESGMLKILNREQGSLSLKRSRAVTICRSEIYRADFMGKPCASKFSAANLFVGLRTKIFRKSLQAAWRLDWRLFC